MAIKRSEITAPALPKESAFVASLGGEVIVRGLLLKDRLALFADTGSSGHAHVSRLLAACVVDADNQQLFTQDEWEAFGAAHFDEALELFKVVRRVSGLDAEVIEKN